MPTIKLEIVTPQKIAYEQNVELLEAPAIDGLIGILPRHAPLVTALKIGVIRVKNGEEEILISISEGFMEVKPVGVNVVVRTAELPKEIDIERAEKAKKRAEQRLETDDSQIDEARAETALQRALSRLKAYHHYHRKY